MPVQADQLVTLTVRSTENDLCESTWPPPTPSSSFCEYLRYRSGVNPMVWPAVRWFVVLCRLPNELASLVALVSMERRMAVQAQAAVMVSLHFRMVPMVCGGGMDHAQ